MTRAFRCAVCFCALLATSVAPSVVHAQKARPTNPFPRFGLLPKQETGALRLLKKHPEYDGRGVVVAILDTGVDPAAEGLQKTSDGKPKIVDILDGSGSGDVATTTVREAQEDAITGLSGKQLKLPKKPKAANGRYHVGVKRAYELFPPPLVTRMKAERKKKWEQHQRARAVELERKRIAFDAQHKKPNREQKKQRDELTARIEELSALRKSYSDPGPIYDCAVFHDGQHWRALIDTDEDGDLSDEKALTNYRVERQYGTFDTVSLANFTVNIYDDGKLLSIVTDCGTHATHVAGIVAGNFPEQPELNGLAPGAQIVSVKIGDRRLGSSSTNMGQVRGLIAVLRNRCDLINMSYGGATRDPNSGRIAQLYSEIVNKHGVIFVASAGNNGPALSTVGSPGGTTSALLGVGAYVSPELMKVAYAVRGDRTELPFTWTSRGPAADGDLGVDICAPGGAISPVSQWSLRRNRLANGTSMAAPNACGGIALVLSALKAKEMSYTPHSIRRALLHTARSLKGAEPFATGHGLIQVDKALEHLLQNPEPSARQGLRLEVRFPDHGNRRGLYLREARDNSRPLLTRLRVIPHLPENATSEAKARFDLRLTLQATESWVEIPEQAYLAYASKSFEIKVDPSKLPPGAHFAEVVGYDADAAERGAVFRAPITVIRPTPLDDRGQWSEKMELTPGRHARRFFDLPAGATWVDVKIRANPEMSGPRRVVLHVLQQPPRRAYGRGFQREYITMDPGAIVVRSFPVVGGQSLELCAGQYWSHYGGEEFTVELACHGLRPEPAVISLDDRAFSSRLEVVSTVGAERFGPAGTLDRLRTSVNPTTARLRPLSPTRDQLPENRQVSELLLSYRFSLDAPATVTVRTAWSLQEEMFGTFESLLVQVFDQHKRLVASGSQATTARLQKGTYHVRSHVRHTDTNLLKKLERSALLLERRLSKPLALGFYADPDDALAGGSRYAARRLQKSERGVVFIARPGPPPKFAQPGDVLLGRLTLGAKTPLQDGAGQRPGGYWVEMLITGPRRSSTAAKRAAAGEDYIYRAQLSRLAALRAKKDREAFDKLAEQMLKDLPAEKQMPVLLERLKLMDGPDRKRRLPEIVEACNEILKRIRRKRLAAHYGVRLNTDDPAAVKKRAEMDRQKQILTDTLYRKGRAIAYMDLPPKPGQPKVIPKKPKKKKARDKLFEQTYAELRQWADMTDPKFVLLNIRRERRHERPARALKLLNAMLQKVPPEKRLYQKRADIYGELGWDDWRAYELRWMRLRFPPAFPPF